MSEPEAPRQQEPAQEGEQSPYRTEQFAFVDSEQGAEDSGWLAFMHSRAGRRADRREAVRERLILLAALGLVLALAAALVAWSPWSPDAPPADTGDLALGADRVPVLLQVQAVDGSAAATAILLHDRRDGGSGAVVAIPPELVLPVAGEGRLTVRSALAQAGPTLTGEAVGELLGVPLAGSWVIDAGSFVSLVDQLGGVPAAGGVIDGEATLARLASSDAAAVEALSGFVAAFGGAFTPVLTLLDGFGVLPAPGLPVDRLAAVLSGLSRDGAAGRIAREALPLGPAGGLDVAAALPVVRDVLGGEPGQGRGDATPRIVVSISPRSAVAASDAQADISGAGYEYVDGGAAAAGAASSVTVRPSVPDARALGEAVATTLGLPASAVALSEDVPFVADVAVVLGAR